MRSIAYSFVVSNAHYRYQVKGQHTGAQISKHLHDVLDRFEVTDGHSLGITTDNAYSNYSITCELQSTFDASVIERPVLRYYIPCMAHVIHPTLGAFISSLGVKGCTQSWEAHERNHQFGENDGIEIGNSQRLREEGYARFNKVAPMRPRLAKIIEKVRISRYFESPETDLQIAANVCCVDYNDTWSSKQVHWMSKSQSAKHSTINYRCEDTVEFDTVVSWVRLPIRTIHSRMAQ